MHRRVDDARRHRIKPDVVSRVLERQRLAHGRQGLGFGAVKESDPTLEGLAGSL